METTESLAKLFATLRFKGDEYIRFALNLSLIWFAALLVAALVPLEPLAMVLIVIPVVAGALVLRSQPTVLLAVMTADELERIRNAIFIMLATQVWVGVYVWLVPIHNDRMLALPLLGLVVVYGFLAQVVGLDPRPFYRKAMKVHALALIAITAIFILGGRDAVGNLAHEVAQKTEAAFEESLPAPEATEHTVGTCDEPRVKHEVEGEITVIARHDCWSEVIAVPASAASYGSRNEGGECIEFFFPDPTGEVEVAGERGVIQNGCDDSSRNRRGIFRVRTEAAPTMVVVYYH